MNLKDLYSLNSFTSCGSIPYYLLKMSLGVEFWNLDSDVVQGLNPSESVKNYQTTVTGTGSENYCFLTKLRLHLRNQYFLNLSVITISGKPICFGMVSLDWQSD